MPPSGHHHRSGGLRQSNKRNKRSTASKRSVTRALGGKVNARRSVGSVVIARSKADRRHMMQQKREASRQAVLQKKRGLGGAGTMLPPRVIGMISLGESPELETRLLAFLLKGADQVIVPALAPPDSTVTARYNVHKKDGTLTFVTNSKAFCPAYGTSDDAAVLAALDLCRVCDAVLLLVDGNGPTEEVLGMRIGGDERSSSKSTMAQDWDHLFSERGDRILTAIKGQGLPTPLTILAHTVKEQLDEDYMTMQSGKSIRRSALKRRMDLKRYVGRFATTEFGPGNDKVIEVDLSEDNDEVAMDDGDDDDEDDDDTNHAAQTGSSTLVRTLCTMAAKPPKWVADAPRSYLLSDTHQYDGDRQELKLTGYLRGHVPFDVNSLIHVPNMGTFACKSIRKALPPLSRKKEETVVEVDTELLADPSKRESLDMFATPDALDGEQNLVGFDETIHEEEYEGEDDHNKGVERPAGWSDYQSAWLDAVDDISVAEGEEIDHGELAKELNKKTIRFSGASVATGGMDLDDDNEISAEERDALLSQRRKAQKDELEFPDEVQVQEDVNARDRYARYRSLKSFRKSHWDPKENLPESYSSIYHFSSFRATQRDVMADMKDLTKAANSAMGNFWGSGVAAEDMEPKMDDQSDGDEDEDLLEGCVPSGSYVTVTLEKVTKDAYSRVSSGGLIAAVTLLAHENKVSVLHMGLSQSVKCEQATPVKSKDVLTFRCGWRTWQGRPVFSQNNLNSDKHKLERFLPQGGAFFAASVYGPVTYTPCPVILFRERSVAGNPGETDGSTARELLAIGSMIGADADRIVVKSVVLTGYPVRVHKRYATVKYMFYNPEDVKWFKPAGLTTKHGLSGNIIASNGEHGTMKCLFNAPIKQHDTVCLPLYKRVYPKLAPLSTKSDDGASLHTSAARAALIVL